VRHGFTGRAVGWEHETITRIRDYEVTLVSEDEGGFSVFVPQLLSVATLGDTREEAYANAKETIQLYLDVMAEDGLPLPLVEHGRVAVGA